MADSPTFVCNSCGRHFSTKTSLKRHISNHDKKNTVFACHLCSRKYSGPQTLKNHIDKSHMQSFDCAICSKTFLYRKRLTDHIRWVHNPESQVLYECYHCSRAFRRKERVARHINSCRNNPENRKFMSIECPLCLKKYCGKRTLENHMEKAHMNSFECGWCSKTFSCRKNLTDHIRWVHNQNEQISFECYYCTRTFLRRMRLVEHIRNCRSNPNNEKSISNVNRFKCGVCNQVFQSKVCINQHYRTAHEITLEVETLTLNSFDEFNEWKSKTQWQSITQFVIQHSSETKTHRRKVLVCHRSSINRTHSRRVTDEKFPKQIGSKKLDTFCPAEMVVRVRKADGACDVAYTKTHIGHSINDRKELQHVYLTKEDRQRLSVQLKDGLPRNATRKRERLLESEEVGKCLSIERATRARGGGAAPGYIIDERTFDGDGDDDVGADIFVENNADSVLYYKDQSMEDTRFGVLADDDYVLVLMNRTQEKYLRRYADNVVCFDGTRGDANEYGFALHALLVLDVDRVGYPAAFLITNRSDRAAIDVFLRCVRERVGRVETRVIMTGVQSAYYDSWVAVMKAVPEIRLYCAWHVNEAWQKRFARLGKSHAVQEAKQQLHGLRYELNPFLFDEKLAKFLAIDDDDVKEFVEYFRQNYAQTPHFWAYCHRPLAGINVDMSLESFHKQIKYRLEHGVHANWLRHTLKLLKEYLELRDAEEEMKNIRGVDCSKHKYLRRAHHEARRHCKDKNVDELIVVIDDDTYFVPSFPESNITYIVTKQQGPKECTRYDDVTCGLQCQLCEICFHEYTCNCLQNSIRSCMCKHIHMVGIYKQKQKPAVDVSVEWVPVTDVSDTNDIEEQQTDLDIAVVNNLTSTNVMDEETFEKLRKDAHNSLDRGLKEARIHGPNFVRKCIKEYLDQMTLAIQVESTRDV